MDKKLKETLTNAKITIKWKNCGIWQNEESKNLFDFVKERKIKINKIKKENNFGGYYKIKMQINSIKFEEITAYYDLERKLYDFVGYRCLYLGDKSKVITRFGIKNIN